MRKSFFIKLLLIPLSFLLLFFLSMTNGNAVSENSEETVERLTSAQEGCPPGTYTEVTYVDSGDGLVTIKSIYVWTGARFPIFLSVTENRETVLASTWVGNQPEYTWAPDVTTAKPTVRVVVGEPRYCMMVKEYGAASTVIPTPSDTSTDELTPNETESPETTPAEPAPTETTPTDNCAEAASVTESRVLHSL